MPPPRSFVAVLDKYSDLSRCPTDKLTTHSYGPIYESLCTALPHDACIMEVGILGGRFLQALVEYLPEARVYGVDLQPETTTLVDSAYPWADKVRLVQADATKDELLEKVGHERFDLIIEDGSHMPLDQVRTLDLLVPLLKPGGTYVVEDIKQEHADFVRAGVALVAEKHGLVYQWIDLRHIKGTTDDIVAVVRRP